MEKKERIKKNRPMIRKFKGSKLSVDILQKEKHADMRRNSIEENN